MAEMYVPLISALAGAIIGSGASILAIVIQSRYQNRRELYKVATEAAMEDHKQAMEAAKAIQGAWVAPLSAFMYFHIRFMELAAKNELTKNALLQLKDERDELFGEPE